MRLSVSTYIPGDTPVHASDARVKFVLLLALSVTVFCVNTWAGLGIIALALGIIIVLAKLPWGRLCALSVPLLGMLALIWVCNAFMLDVFHPASSVLSGVSAGFATGWSPVALIGSFGFSPEGCMYGLFYAVRILIILFASFVVTFTTTATDLTYAFVSLLSPLRIVRVPVDDVAMMLSVGLRFIPVTADELIRVRNAQLLRGAPFESESLWRRLLAWQTVFVPLIVGLFKRANALAQAMESRCYGAEQRTCLHDGKNTPAHKASLVIGLVFCAAIAIVY